MIEEEKKGGFRQVKRSRTERLAFENSQCSSKMKANYVTKMERSSKGKYIEKEVKLKKKKKQEEEGKKHYQC